MRTTVPAFLSLAFLCACGVDHGTTRDALDEELGDAPVELPPGQNEEVLPEDEDDDDGDLVEEIEPDDVVEEPVVEDPDEAATPDEAAAPGECVEYSTRHLHASMQHTDSIAQRRQAIDRAFVNPDGVTPDTISWTEIETQAQIDRIQNKAGWSTYWPHQPNNPVVNPRNAVPISWKDGVYEFVSGSSHKASDGLAGVSPHRYVTRVRLLHKPSGTYVVRVAHHAVSGVDSPNKSHRAYRLAAHAQDIAMFNDVMLGAAYPAIGAADFNTTHLRGKLLDENNGVQKYRFDVPESGGSHGSRLIDWIVHRKKDDNAYHLDAVRFVDLTPSDHKGVRARYIYRPPPCH